MNEERERGWISFKAEIVHLTGSTLTQPQLISSPTLVEVNGQDHAIPSLGGGWGVGGA